MLVSCIIYTEINDQHIDNNKDKIVYKNFVINLCLEKNDLIQSIVELLVNPIPDRSFVFRHVLCVLSCLIVEY